MKIRVYVKDMETGQSLEELGTCLCDSPMRALQMYNNEIKWENQGYAADIAFEILGGPSVSI